MRRSPLFSTVCLAFILSGVSCATTGEGQAEFSEALSHQKRGDSAKARAAYDQLLKGGSTSVGPLNNRAVLDLHDGDWRPALRLLRRGLDAHPDAQTAQANQLYAHFLSGQYAGHARSEARRILPGGPAPAALKLAAGIVLSSAESDWEAAVALLERVITAEEKDVRAQGHFALGLVFARQGQLKRAAQQFQSHTQLERSAAAHYNRAVILTRLQQYEAALNETQVAISLDVKKSTAWYLQAFVNYQLGRLSDASGAIRAGLLQEPARPGFHFLAGVIYAKNGERNAAHTSFQRETEVAPESADAWYNLGLLQCEASQWDEALASFKQVLALQPDHAQAANNQRVIQAIQTLQ